MENHQKPAFGFVQNRVPWIVAGAALLDHPGMSLDTVRRITDVDAVL